MLPLPESVTLHSHYFTGVTSVTVFHDESHQKLPVLFVDSLL